MRRTPRPWSSLSVLQYPPTGLSSGNLLYLTPCLSQNSTCSTLLRVYPLATSSVLRIAWIGCALAVPSYGSLLWQRSCKIPAIISTNLAVPSYGALLWQLYRYRSTAGYTILAVPSYGSLLWQLNNNDMSIESAEFSCSTLLRVSPLATYERYGDWFSESYLQYPPTGLSSGNIFLNIAILLVDRLAVPSYGSLLWQLLQICFAATTVPQLAVPSYGSLLWQPRRDEIASLARYLLQYPPTGLSSGNQN